MGRLNRIIEIQRRTVHRDSYGAEVLTWATLAKVWAEKVETKPSERFIKTARKTVNKSTASFRINALGADNPDVLAGGVVSSPDDPNELDRIIDDNGILWDIIGIIKNDRQFLTLQVGHLA